MAGQACGLGSGPSAAPSHSARLTRAPDGWWVAIAHMDHMGLQRGASASIVLRNGGQRLETPCTGVHQDGCRIGLGEPPWLRYAQSRTEARLTFDGQRIAHLVVRPDSDRPLSAALMDLSANGVGAFLPHALADELRCRPSIQRICTCHRARRPPACRYAPRRPWKTRHDGASAAASRRQSRRCAA